MNNYVCITDGAYSSSRASGGIGLIILKDDKVVLEYSKKFDNTTNNKMELTAILIGLKAIKKSIDSFHIVSDSQYALGSIFKGWKRNKNIELLNLIDKELERVKQLCPSITYEHIRGHGKGNPTKWDKWNNRADHLAVLASQQL